MMMPLNYAIVNWLNSLASEGKALDVWVVHLAKPAEIHHRESNRVPQLIAPQAVAHNALNVQINIPGLRQNGRRFSHVLG